MKGEGGHETSGAISGTQCRSNIEFAFSNIGINSIHLVNKNYFSKKGGFVGQRLSLFLVSG